MKMALTEQGFKEIREAFLQQPGLIIATEKKYMTFLSELIFKTVEKIRLDFNKANDLRPFWENYKPRQRGRAYIGDSVPWIEVAEKTVTAHMIRILTLENLPQLEYPGLPLGGDVRFMLEDVIIHLDVKATGPRDSHVEVNASPFQISGDGKLWDSAGFRNSQVSIPRQNRNKGPVLFVPALPPFYVIEGRSLLCLTYFLKVNYRRDEGDKQLLDYIELVCAPNGLLLFDGPQYHKNTTGLLISGKDDQTVLAGNRRVRVRFIPLATIGDWPRCVQFQQENGQWIKKPRLVTNNQVVIDLGEN